MALKLDVSTRMEQAWYMDPEALAGDPDVDRPLVVEIDAESPLGPDATVALGDLDLEELPAALPGLGDEARQRHYRQASLVGAILAADEPARPSGAGLRASMTAVLERLGGRSSHGVRAALARGAAALLEPGSVAPTRIAAVAFLAGVGMTLVGVLIAL